MSMYEAMKSLAVPEETETKTIFESGVKLGKQLEVMEDGARWQVMADFWAEMMLYLAPSDNVKDHIEQLARGGEFITHLWALLSHAGILKRDQEHQAGGNGECSGASDLLLNVVRVQMEQSGCPCELRLRGIRPFHGRLSSW